MSGTGPRGKITEWPPSGDSGTARTWERVIRGRRYGFTAIVAPGGERRYSARRLDSHYAWDWQTVGRWTFPRAERRREYVATFGRSRVQHEIAGDWSYSAIDAARTVCGRQGPFSVNSRTGGDGKLPVTCGGCDRDRKRTPRASRSRTGR
jgi:hypothetical protein